VSSRSRTGYDGRVEWPLVLHSGAGRARVRPWWHDTTVAQITFADHGEVPSSTGLRVWLCELRARGFASVRSGAVSEGSADTLQRQGFQVVQRLHLLDLSLVGWQAPRDKTLRTTQLRVRDRTAAADVDRAAFGDPWAIDTVGISETCAATPAHRSRAIDGAQLGAEGLVGYAVTGRANYTGYLQRLAVQPEVQARGVGWSLTHDSLTWMQKRRLTRAMVNTHIDNDVALGLYRRFGFRVLPQGLVVLARGLDDL
jgi:ribosomal protein S18 acetylase RimI-like enzyme